MRVYIVQTTYLDDGYTGSDIVAVTNSLEKAKEKMQEAFKEDWVQDIIERESLEPQIEDESIILNENKDTDWVDIVIDSYEVEDGEYRKIKLYDDHEETFVETNAPQELIKEAIQFRNEQREKESNNSLSDFEIIQTYLEEKGYDFSVTDTEESYKW